MKVLALLLAFSLNAVGGWAQADPQTPDTSSPHATHPDGHAMAMHRHMQMQEQVTKMRATLNRMKANLDKISDPALKEHAQLNVELWESMVQHMEDMVKMMPMHGGMNMGTTKPETK